MLGPSWHCNSLKDQKALSLSREPDEDVQGPLQVLGSWFGLGLMCKKLEALHRC